MNSVFGIKNTEFIIGFKKITKLVCLATWGARMALAVVHNDGLWQSSMAGVVNAGYCTFPKAVVVDDGQ